MRKLILPLRWLGLILCVGIILIWVASLAYEFNYIQPGANWNSFVRVAYGQVGMYSQSVPFVPPATSHFVVRRISFNPDWTWDVHVIALKTWVIILPFWMILGVAASITAALWWRRWHRHLPGHCPRCNYNLTGNTTGTCPECGSLLAYASRAGTNSSQEATRT